MKKKEKLLVVILLLILAFVGEYYFISNANNSNAATTNADNTEIILWNYSKASDSNEFGFPANYQKYVMPDNSIVRQYAKQLKVGLYWNYLTYENESIFNLSYQNDTDEGVWQNPDYTLAVGHGDCEDIALAVCSILKAKKIEAVVVMGHCYNSSTGEKNGHSWVEYYLDGNYYISDRFSFERKIMIENEIAYYFSPEITAVSSDHPNQTIFSIAPVKYQPRYIFNDKLKKRPYLKDWAISGLEI